MRFMLFVSLFLLACTPEPEVQNACAYSPGCMDELHEACDAREFHVWTGEECRPMTEHERCVASGGDWVDQSGMEYDVLSGEYTFVLRPSICRGGR